MPEQIACKVLGVVIGMPMAHVRQRAEKRKGLHVRKPSRECARHFGVDLSCKLGATDVAAI